MTTTTTDLDAIRARLLNVTEGPWAIWPDLRPEGLITIGDATGVIPEGEMWTDGPSNTVAHVYTEEDAEFIVHAPEDIRALLDELAAVTADRDGYRQMFGKLDAATVQIEQDRDAAREELAKTRAELVTMTAVAKSNKRVTKGYAQELSFAYRLLRECFDAYGHLMDIGNRREEIRAFLAANAGAEANPATTAEPAAEPKATCHLPVQNGEPCGLLTCRKHGCRVAPHAEPAAS